MMMVFIQSNKNKHRNFTHGKLYDCDDAGLYDIDDGINFYITMDDKNRICTIGKSSFITIIQYRKLKLQKLQENT
jgi:hypothetical protein